MVDRVARKQAAETLRHFLSGQITSDEFIPAKFRMHKTLVVFLLWVFLTIGCAIGGAGVLNLRKFYELSERGVPVQGQITSTEPENHGAIHYSYSVKQQRYSGIGGAEDMRRKFDEVTVGDTVPVVYNPADPESSCLGDADKQFTSLTHGFFFISLFPTFTFLVYYLKNWAKKTSGSGERAA